MKTKIISILLSAVLITGLLASAVSAEEGTISVSRKEYPCYLVVLENATVLPLYFVNGVEDLPYIDLKDWTDLSTTFIQFMLRDTGYNLDLETDEDMAQLTRENGYTMLFDFKENTISFEDLDMFVHSSSDGSLIDMIKIRETDEEGNPRLLAQINKGSFDRFGKEVVVDLSEYDIHMYCVPEEGLYLVPLHTMSLFLFSLFSNISIFFNETAVYIANAGAFGEPEEPTSLGESWYAGEKKEMSEELARYNYGELCLALDYLYGLKEIHDITSFDQMFYETGYKYFLSSTYADIADGALRDFIYYYLDDLHSGFEFASYRSEEMLATEGKGLSSRSDSEMEDLYTNARSGADHTIPTYEEVGNTAYITFDRFLVTSGSADDYYNETIEISEDPSDQYLDTVALVIDAHKKICREDSPIENVVLDLSLNGGGTFDAAVFVISWFLGDAAVSIRNSLTGAISTGTYRADTNLDGVFDEKDTIADKNLYCLIGPYSFSCGNLVPSALKSSHKVTLLGQTSGGGSCSVLPLSTADGSIFRISSPYRMSYLKNGSYYDTDTGIDPDCVIIKPENFYNREALTEYINHLF